MFRGQGSRNSTLKPSNHGVEISRGRTKCWEPISPMATLCKFPCFVSLPPHKIFLTHIHGYPPRRRSGICGFSAKKPRGRVKNNVELCTEIREFISAVGLPDGYVPTMKELANHGRTDLAYIVRRRGYKVIRDLLSNASEVENDKCSSAGTSLSSEQEAGSGKPNVLTGHCEKVGYTVENGSVSILSNNCIKLDGEEKQLLDDSSSSTSSHYVEPPVKEVSGILQDSSLSSEGLMLNDYEPRVQDENNSSEDVSALFEAPNIEASESSVDNFPGAIFSDGRTLSKSTSCSSVEEKVEKFIHGGELDTVEDNVYGLLSESATEEIGEVNEHELELTVQSQLLPERKFQQNVGGGDETLTANGNALASNQVIPPETVHHHDRNSHMGAEGPENDDLYQDLDAETSRREKQVEINRLKFMLNQKELELSHLKEQIEKEKLALSVLQTKAETEIRKVQKLISDKDAELIAAEESLSGLVEVEVQYNGDGNTVEVAGSFNGWHHCIRMDPEPLSTGTHGGGSRQSPLWSVLLWLYPGVYEIKFVVDGQWVVDPKRESVTKAGICNNILRVDR